MTAMRPIRRLSVAATVSLLALGSCQSNASGELDPAIEVEFRQRNDAAAESAARLEAPERVLTDLDKALDKYAEFRMNSGSLRIDSNSEKLAQFIRQEAQQNFEMLVNQANSSRYPRNRAIAVAALGFSGRPDALDPIVNGVMAENIEVRNNAVFGLAILQDSRTPPALVAAVMNDETLPDTVRAGAAWSLIRIQQSVVEPAAYFEIWDETLAGAIDAPPSAVAVSAVRGLGLSRDAKYYEAVVRYVSHPTPLVRTATAIAIGRVGDLRGTEALYTLLGREEPNENVRLAARKALQALAGGEDRGYDVDEWRKVFDLR